MKAEHKVAMARAGFAVLAALAGVGTVAGINATKRVSAMEQKQAVAQCQACPDVKVDCSHPPIKGELLFK